MAKPTFLQRIAQKMLGSRVFSAILYGSGYTDYTKWDKRKMVEQAYERNPVYAAITDRIAELVSHLPLYVESRGTNGKLIQSYNHPILDALDRSEGGMIQLLNTLSRYIDVTGEGYLQKIVSADDSLVGFVVLPSQYINPVQGTVIQPIIAFDYIQNGRVRLEADEVIYIRRQSLSEYWHGNSQTIANAEVIDFQNASITWNKNLALRGGQPSFVIKMPGAMPQEVQEYRENWMKVNGGAVNKGAPAIDTGMNTEIANGINFKPNEMELVKGIEVATRLIAMRRGFPSELLNDPSGKTYANVTEATKTLYRDIIIPQAELILNAITRDASKYYRDKPVIKIDESKIPALAEDQKQLIDRLVTAAGGAIITVNDARDIMNLPPSELPEHNVIGRGVPLAETVEVTPEVEADLKRLLSGGTLQ